MRISRDRGSRSRTGKIPQTVTLETTVTQLITYISVRCYTCPRVFHEDISLSSQPHIGKLFPVLKNYISSDVRSDDFQKYPFLQFWNVMYSMSKNEVLERDTPRFRRGRIISLLNTDCMMNTDTCQSMTYAFFLAPSVLRSGEYQMEC